MIEKEEGMNYKDLYYNFEGFKNKENEAIAGTKETKKNLVDPDDKKQQGNKNKQAS